jgi:hypothetical protein
MSNNEHHVDARRMRITMGRYDNINNINMRANTTYTGRKKGGEKNDGKEEKGEQWG